MEAAKIEVSRLQRQIEFRHTVVLNGAEHTTDGNPKKLKIDYSGSTVRADTSCTTNREGGTTLRSCFVSG